MAGEPVAAGNRDGNWGLPLAPQILRSSAGGTRGLAWQPQMRYPSGHSVVISMTTTPEPSGVPGSTVEAQGRIPAGPPPEGQRGLGPAVTGPGGAADGGSTNTLRVSCESAPFTRPRPLDRETLHARAQLVARAPAGWGLVSAMATMEKVGSMRSVEGKYVRRDGIREIEAQHMDALIALVPEGWQLLSVRAI